MNRDDLFKLFDLGGNTPHPDPSELKIASHAESAHVASHPTALELDEWALRKGREVLAESERLQALTLDEYAVADFFAAGFLPDPQLHPDCADSLRHGFVSQLLDTPEYRALHQTTMLRETAAAIAATSFAEQFSQLQKEEKHDKDEPAKPTEKVSLDREMATLRAVSRALATAAEEVREVNEATSALGLGPGSPGANDPKNIAALYRRVRNSPELRRICELAGRYRRVAQSKQRQKLVHGMDDLVGVTLSGDVSRLLPVELGKLAIPELELDMLRRLIERQCLSREHRSVESIAKGPIIISVDESGSMSGEKVHTAKALALALAWIARQQGRWCALIAYSGDSGERLLALPPGKWDEMALMDWLEAFIGHGSSLDVPVREMPRYYRHLDAPAGKTDVIFVTDAQCHIPESLQLSFCRWKQQVQARLITLVIQSEPGDLTAISDEVHLVASLAVTEAAVERTLSI